MENESTVLANLLQGLQKDRDMFLKRGLELALKKSESDRTEELFTAFVKAQAEFGPIAKTSKGYNYKFAPMENILEEVRPVLNKNGLTFYQTTDDNNILYTRIRHTSGQFIESRIKLIEPSGTDSKRSAEQAFGSSVTYMRRYQLLAILGIQPSNEDDDSALPYQKGQ